MGLWDFHNLARRKGVFPLGTCEVDIVAMQIKVLINP